MPKAVANITPVSPYHNHDVGDLADEIGKLCAEMADLEARRKNFREELIRRGVAEAEGALFRLLPIGNYPLVGTSARCARGLRLWMAT